MMMAISTLVIPGRAKREPGISRNNLEIPGSMRSHRPGMTEQV
ncbi:MULTISPECIES: hypothetical protein [unclassified Bradyrhizobium]|nr:MULTISPECIES: hypothetical protein [unclassified Bradyrhizobium]